MSSGSDSNSVPVVRGGGGRAPGGDYLGGLGGGRRRRVGRLRPAPRAETGDLRARAEELRLHPLRRLENALDIVRRHPGLTAYDIAGKNIVHTTSFENAIKMASQMAIHNK